MATRRRAPEQLEHRPSTLAEWKKLSRLEVTLSSGAKVTCRTLTLDELAALEALPDDLLEVALLEQSVGLMKEIGRRTLSGKPADLKKAAELSAANLKLRDRLVLAATVEPKLKPADLAALDPFDKAEIAAFTQRRLNVDATGKKVGADALDTFRSVCAFLGQSETDPARKAVLLDLAESQ